MTNMLHSDSRRLYSWWWNSHISPKNSKWLQENLTDMDSNVKTMIKLIEEDADSFARRAEMYYKKRPELMKMVEEFYRAYRALAERYDHATGALRQAQKTMAEAFPNQIPFALTDESSSSSSGNEMEPHTPEMHAPVRALFDSDDIQKDPLVISSNFHAIKRRGAYAEENDALRSRKGLKQLNEMISAGEDSANSFLAEGGVKKVLSFQDEGKNSEYKTPYCSKDLPNQESSEEQDGRDEVKFSEEISQLSQENTKLKSQITSESERADKAEDEVQTLKFSLSKLKIEMEDSISKYQQSLERIFNLEAQISHTQDDLKKLNDDVVNGSMKLCSAQEQCVLLEKTNQCLQLEQGMKEQKAKTQQEKLGKVQEESEKLNNTIQDERQRVMEAEIAIQIMEKLQSQYQEDLKLLTLEVERGIDKMKAMELRNTGLEEEIWHLKEENDSLNEQNLSSALKIKNLQDNIIILKETGEELEHKMGLNLEQTKGIQHEFDRVKEEKDDLERRYQGLMEKMEAVSLNAESLQQLLKELQGGHAELEEICKKQEDEKLLLLTNLKNMEKISEKNKVLELSLSDANIELEELRGRIKTLEGSCESAYGQIITHISEKAALVSQLETVAQNMEKMTEDNAFLGNSVSDMNSELEDLRGKLKNLEDSYQSLYDQKANLVAENNILVSQVDSISQSIKGMESRYVELEDKHFNLEREKNSTLHQINELECFLKLEKQECEVLTHSNKRQLATMENQIHFLQEDNQLGEEKFELEQQKLISALLESFVFQTCLNDMKAANLILSKDCQMYLQTSRCAEELVLQLEQKDLVQKKEIKSLSEYNEKLSENNAFLEKSLSDINAKLEDLRVKLNSSEESYLSLYDQKTNLLAEINARVCQVESTSQRLKSLESRHAELKDKHTHIQREKDSTLHQLKEVECLLKLKKQEQEALTRSSMSQLATMGNQIRLLREERQVREEEFEVEQQNVKSALFESFIFQRCLYDMNAKNLILLNDFRKHLQTSRCTEELVSKLEQMDLVQKKKIKSLSEDYEKLTENNIFLECSLSFMNIELEEKRGKLKNLEQSNQSLCDQKKNLLSENNTLVSQVESTSQRLKSLESRHAELKDKHTHIQREKDSTLHQLKEVECLLKLEKQEQEALTRSSKSQLATLGNQIRLLREERQVREEEFEVEQQKVTSALFESFIFQRCLYDMNAKNLILSNDFQKHLQTSRCTEELVSQLEQMDLVQKKRVKSLSEDYEKLTENNIFLECSLSFMKAELEEMIGKLKNLEQSNQSLCDEKKNLLSENNILVSQVGSISQSLKCLESRHADLEGNHLQLEKDKDLTLHHVVELECLLKLEKEQRETHSQSNKSQLATLENQIHILRKESRITEEEFEMEQQKVMNALFEIFILQRCVDDMEARNLILSKECQKHLQASTCAAEEISQLGQKDLIQMEKITSLSDHNKKLREGMLQLLSELNSNKEFESTVGVKDEVLLQIISDEIRMLLNSISDNQDEILHLELEILVIVTTLNQIGLDGKDIRREKDYLKLELEIREKELLVSQSKNQELVELKEHLRQDVQIRGQIVEELKTTIGTLHRKLSDMQQAHRTLQTEIHSLLNENQSLLAKFENLRDKNDLLDEENTAALAEAMTLEHLYLLFRSSNAERELDLKLCIDELGSLSAVKSNLDQEVAIMKEQMSQLEVENVKLKESAAYLEESRNRLIISEFDLNLARYVHEELNHQMETGKNLLMEKEVDLSEANLKVRSMQDMNIELSRNLANLIKEIDEGKMVRERMENMASSLSEGIALRDKNITNISEANNMLYIKLEKLHNEVEELKNREEHLTSILKEGISEVDQCGKDFAELLNENHISSVCAAIFEDKLFELILACESLDIFSMVQKQAVNEAISSRKIFIIELKTKLDELEQENRGLKGDLDAYLPLIMSIWIGIASVEEQNLSLAGPRASNPQQKQDNSPVSHQDDQTSPSSEDHSTMAPAVGLLQLQKLVKKVEALQNMIGETGRLIEQERSDASMKENEALRLKGNAIREEGHISKDIIMELIQEDEENGDAGISKMRIEQMTKDIQLDEVSSSPPHVNDVGQHGLTRIGSSEIDDQMLELWEAAERNCDTGMHKLLPIALEQDINPVEKEKSEYTSSELITEKELSIDRLELPKQLQEPHQELNKNVIERLALDSERLSVLRTSVEELKRKIEGSVKIKRPKSLEYDAVKMKLKEAEGGILELIDINTKSNDLRRGPEGIGSTGRRQLSDCSRSSEKIGNLELELQKIQYILLKLDEEHENSRTRGTDRGAKVLLREYICERREKFRKKKVPFCGCMRPKTMDD